MNGHILLLTGAAPYLGGQQTWQPLHEAAPDLNFRDLDLLAVSTNDDFIPAMKAAIEAASEEARAIVAHGTIASVVLEAIDSRSDIPVVLLSPVAVTKDSLVLRGLRALLNGPAGSLLTAVARSKRQKLLADESYLRRQMELLVRKDKISNGLIQEARERLADPRMDAILERTSQTLRALLTPTSVFERFKGASFFGSGPIDRKARKRLNGTFIESAWSAPMLETPELIAAHLRAMRLSESVPRQS